MFIESLEITLFGMAIVFVMLLLIILAVKVIEPVRRFFAGLFKRDKGTEPEKEARPAPADGKNAAQSIQAAPQGAGAEAFLQGGALKDGAQSPQLSAENIPGAPDGGTVAAIIAAIEAASGLNSRQFVLYSVRRRPARRNNNIF